MAIFRRRKQKEPESIPDTVEPDDDQGEDLVWEVRGPKDADGQEAPDGYLDLGALYVPRIKGLQIRGNFEADKVTMRRVLLVLGSSGITVSVAAAPTSGGAWPELATQIEKSVTTAGGSVEREDGPYGLELQSRVATSLPDGSKALAPLRIIGCEGPRWLTRIDMQGAAVAGDKAQKKAMEDLIDRLIIRRDDAPRIRFELLPLRLPKEALSGEETN